jgi:NAD(P)-dependent dehydrogenase (short-subunit alcohol dehydrogenase family)
VVEEIEAAGGEAMANGASVTHPEQVEAMVAAAKERWGGVHILINNAGILRDRSFAKMSLDDFRAVVDVHLIGSAICTKAVWGDDARPGLRPDPDDVELDRPLRQFRPGQLRRGQAGPRRLRQDSPPRRRQIRYPGQRDRADRRDPDDGGHLPARAARLFNPDNVVPAALYLVSEDAPSNAIVGAGGGVVQAAYVTLTPGYVLPEGRRTVEEVAANWDRIADRTLEIVPQSGAEQATLILKVLQGQ